MRCSGRVGSALGVREASESLGEGGDAGSRAMPVDADDVDADADDEEGGGGEGVEDGGSGDDAPLVGCLLWLPGGFGVDVDAIKGEGARSEAASSWRLPERSAVVSTAGGERRRSRVLGKGSQEGGRMRR